MALLTELTPDVELSRRNRLVVYYIIGLAALIGFYTVTYNVALARLEGVDQSFFASFEFVVQTMTTTGYGQDSGLWSHPLMFLFVSLAQISGIGLGFFTLRLIIIPLFTGAEVNLDNRLTPKDDHVVICGYRRDSAVLLDELEKLDIEYVLLCESKDSAKTLSDEGYAAIHGSPQDASALERARIDAARAVVTDADDANVNTILTVRSLRPDIEVIALTDDSDMREILLETGADTVLSPHGVLGNRLATKAISSLDSELTDAIDLGSDIELMEVPVHPGSRLIGTRIRESRIREETGATIVGVWIDGDLQLPPDPDALIRQNTVLLVLGEHDQLESFSDYTRPARTLRGHERVVLAGFGEVGQAALSVIDDAGVETVTIDTEERAGVDLVGDAATEDCLREAGVESAGALVVGLPDDSAALLTTVLARSLTDDIEILVRVSETGATRKALSAGADYVLSVPQVSARMVASELRGEDVLAPASQIRLVRVPAEPLAGSTLAESGVYERTGCRVIAIEDETGTSGATDPGYRFDGNERITVVGTDDAVQEFLKTFDVSPTEAGG
jgi:Trk K+ transport system NAD-binding subunit